MKGQKKLIVLLICYLLGCLLAAGGFALMAAESRVSEARADREMRLRAITDAVGRMESMAGALAIATAAEEPLPALLAVRREADLAAAALARIESSGKAVGLLRRFALCTAEISGGMADDLCRDRTRVPDYALLIRLSDSALALTEDVLPRALEPYSGEMDDTALIEHFASLGRLYYDGVGSDVRPPSGYLILERERGIGEEEARRIAEGVVGNSARLTRARAEGEPGRYCFTAKNVAVILSASGGHLLSFLYDRTEREADVGAAAAREAAEEMIRTYAPEAMRCAAEETGEGCYLFTFVPNETDYLLLSERILVGIDAASGKMCLWDADRYYRYHTSARTFPEGMLSAEAAANLYGSPAPAVLCIAIRPDGREILCYRLGEEDAGVFVNAVTGKVEPTV